MLKVENDLRTKNRLFARYFPGSYAEMFCCILNDARCERWRQSSRLGIPEYLLILHQGAPKTRWANRLIAILHFAFLFRILYFVFVVCIFILHFIFCMVSQNLNCKHTFYILQPTNSQSKHMVNW